MSWLHIYVVALLYVASPYFPELPDNRLQHEKYIS